MRSENFSSHLRENVLYCIRTILPGGGIVREGGTMMETKPKLLLMSKISYGLGAVGKDMVYMLSASFVLYYFQDVLGSQFDKAGRTAITVAMGVILLVARIFDAFNDPLMGVIVAKTRTKWGKFRPWLLIGTLTNAVVLYQKWYNYSNSHI